MKQDIKEMSYVFQKEKQDKDLIYTIDLVLYKYFEKEFNLQQDLCWSTDFVDNKYYELLQDKDGIITEIIDNNYNNKTNYFVNYFINDDAKLWYLIDNEYLKQLEKCKKYYEKRLKTRNKLKDKELQKDLIDYFEYCFCESKNSIENKLILISSSDFRKATIEDLKINKKNYLDFDKIYNKALNEFKKIHKDDTEDTEEGGGIGFGWKMYGVIKAIETLFKL